MTRAQRCVRPATGRRGEAAVGFRAIGDPDIPIGGDGDAHQSARFASNRSVEARDPDFVERHGRAPPDVVHAHDPRPHAHSRPSRSYTESAKPATATLAGPISKH